MRDDLHKEVTARLKADFGFKEQRTYLRQGLCPKEHGGCGKREVYAVADKPWTLRCGRLDRCGWEGRVKELYPDIFDDWSKRYVRTEKDPHAAADAYLAHQRGFDLMGLRGSYSQEHFHHSALNIGSATVRFPMPGGGYWERIIDQPHRFGKQKANFSYGVGYRGQWWTYPGHDLTTLAQADEIWLAEGIFDTIALVQSGKIVAVSTMSTNNYPEDALAALRQKCGELNLSTPKLIFAFDPGKAGTEFARKYVKRAREDGWEAGAAQSFPDGEGEKLDWNDLAIEDRLKPEDLETYRWNGEVTIAPDVQAKAMLIYRRNRFASFSLTFERRLFWASFSLDRINAALEEMAGDPEFDALGKDEKWDRAAEAAVEVEEIANCVFRVLYFQRDFGIEEGAYFVRVDFPKQPSTKATFSGGAMTTSGEFTKRLASVAPGGLWTGSQKQLTQIARTQWRTIRTVEALQFTGYSIDHSAYIFGDIAVHRGRVIEKNEEDYFVLGRQSVKLRTTERMLRISYDAEKLDLSWARPLTIAYGPKGLVVLAFWVLSLFAEQVRSFQESLGFLEMTGVPGSGKTTLLAFLWRLVGRPGYEGFDPTKATSAGIARTLGQVANLPVVLIEGDRSQETNHSRRFEWDELKTAYDGRAVRTRAIANGGMETFEPPFRGAVVIAQNAVVEGSDAIRERIMGVHFDKGRFSDEGKAAADRLKAAQIADISGFPVHIARREEQILAAYREGFARHEAAMLKHPGCGDYRFAKNHAQLAAMLDAMRIVVTNLDDRDVAAAHRLILAMLVERHQLNGADHPHVTAFWEKFDHFFAQDLETARSSALPNTFAIDHARAADQFAINLVQFETRCSAAGLRLPCTLHELKRHLKTSKSRRFIDVKAVNSRHTGRTVDCWVFANPDPSRKSSAPPERKGAAA
ncbi:toprim domain-containing protein [Sphingomonas sp. CBMAI 2297]|uniref:toprim domain-containing protein n=1 Tax=Sphingomonas sp. CBMAI 2297 TaxID=2991720 RepID=UPI0024578277|nr:toprim domain-containing protein [Sphingomonas sp. CBMAI 2297]MDH4743133.1 toprim domain-containing protein [Sphingomonas sp. CBMAI 2297]